MTGLAISLLLFSALAHASWNLLTRRSGNPEIFTWWVCVSSVVLLAPLAAWLFGQYPPNRAAWPYVGATGLLHTLYFVSLARAYKYGELSFIYPLARGTGLVLIPVLGTTVLGEYVSPQALLGTGIILFGLLSVSRKRGTPNLMNVNLRISNPGFRYAILTGIAIASYSIVDKNGVEHMTPFLYMYMSMAISSAGLFFFIVKGNRFTDFKTELLIHRKAIVITGCLQFTSYTLVLSALTLSPVSYVGPFREIGVVLGVLLGWAFLKERPHRVRVMGSVLIALGAITIAVAP